MAGRDKGFVSVSVLMAIAVSTVLLVWIVNVIAMQYGRGVVRAALDEGARAGATAGVAACEQAAADVLDQLLAGMRDGVEIACVDAGTRIEATAIVHFDGWVPEIPDHDSTMRASAAKENQ